MLGVVIVHIDFGVLHAPDRNQLLQMPVYSFLKILFEALFVCTTNVFVLISGYFGIRYKHKSLISLLFQCEFFFFGIYMVMLCLGKTTLNSENILKCLMLNADDAWFVKAYIALYIIAPVINSFTEHCSQKQLLNMLIIFYIFQTLFGWISNATYFISAGYSAFSFIGLYLIGRYIKIYNISCSSSKSIMMYSLCCIVIGLTFIAGAYKESLALLNRGAAYSSPFVIAAAVFLLLLFKNFRIQNKIINFIAASCFGVFLGHFMIFKYVSKAAIYISHDYSGIIMFILLTVLIFTFYIGCILIDKLRLITWHSIRTLIRK